MMGRSRAYITALAFLGALAFGRDARAADAAEEAFGHGLLEMEAGRFQTGCPMLAESFKMDPRPGVLFTLAECENKWGKLTSALGRYSVYLEIISHMSAADQAKQRERGRDKIAAQEKARLEREIPDLTVSLARDVPAAATVTLDEGTLPVTSLNVPTKVDPGEHVLRVTAPDGRSNDHKVSVAKSEHKSIELTLPPLAPAMPAAPPAAPVASSPAPGEGRRYAAFAVGGAGIAALAVGAISGVLALSDKSTVDGHCVDTACDVEGKRATDDLKAHGLDSTIGLVAGGALLATAIVLYVTLPSAKATSLGRARALVVPTRGGSGLSLSF